MRPPPLGPLQPLGLPQRPASHGGQRDPMGQTTLSMRPPLSRSRLCCLLLLRCRCSLPFTSATRLGDDGSRDIDPGEALPTRSGRKSLLILWMILSKIPEPLGVDADSLKPNQFVPERNGLRPAFSGVDPIPSSREHSGHGHPNRRWYRCSTAYPGGPSASFALARDLHFQRPENHALSCPERLPRVVCDAQESNICCLPPRLPHALPALMHALLCELWHHAGGLALLRHRCGGRVQVTAFRQCFV